MKKSGSVVFIVRRAMPFVWGDAWSLRLRFVAAMFFMLITMGVNVSIPLVLRKVVGLLTMRSPWAVVLWLLIAYAIVWTVSQISQALREVVALRIVYRGGRILTGQVFKHLHALSQRFHTEKSTGAITNIIERAERALPDFFWALFLQIGPTFIEVFVTAVILWRAYGLIYGVTLCAILMVYSAFSVMAMNWSAKAQRRYNEIRKRMSARMVDSLINFETVKQFANHEYEFERCDQLLAQEESAAVERYTKSESVHIGQSIVIGIGLAVLMILSGLNVYRGVQTVADFVTINSYILQFVFPLSFFGYTLRKLRESLVDLEHVFELLDQKPEIVDAPWAVDLWVDNPTIEFTHVSFSYDKRRLILDDVSFVVPAGAMVAFVGATGSGKSTIVKLLFRFYDVTAGSVRIDGVDVRSVSQKSLQRAIGIIPQDTVLFNTTLRENLVYGRPDASAEEVDRAVELARLKELIDRLPDGYNTMIGERGLKISGGERQRIAIARVLLKRPAMYVFDEATSALDVKTEKEIQANLEEISVRKTTIAIAHRLSTVINADTIIVLDKGKIVEQGTHEELLAMDGLYARLWSQQTKSKKK